MSEKDLLDLAERFLTRERGVVYRVRSGHDVFTIFDIIYMKDYTGMVSFYQITTKDHLWSRRQKMINFKLRHGLPKFSYLMGYDYEKDKFIIERL